MNAKAETRTVERINWPAPVQSVMWVGGTHALCCCAKCKPFVDRISSPLCGFDTESFGVMGKPLTCPACIAILRNPVRRAEHA